MVQYSKFSTGAGEGHPCSASVWGKDHLCFAPVWGKVHPCFAPVRGKVKPCFAPVRGKVHPCFAPVWGKVHPCFAPVWGSSQLCFGQVPTMIPGSFRLIHTLPTRVTAAKVVFWGGRIFWRSPNFSKTPKGTSPDPDESIYQKWWNSDKPFLSNPPHKQTNRQTLNLEL